MPSNTVQILLTAKDRATNVIRKATGNFKTLSTVGKKSTKEVEAAFQSLGIKSTAAIEKEKREIVKAFNTIAKSGKASAEEIKRAARAKEEAMRKLSGSFKNASTSANTLKSSLVALGGVLTIGIVAKKFLDSMVQFEKSMANVSTIVDTAKVDMKKFKKEILELAPIVGKKTSELADGLYQVVSAGVDAASAMDVLTVSAKAGVAGLTNTFTAVDIITTGLNAYGKSAKEASFISDQLFTAVRLGKTTFDELARTLGPVLPFAAQLRISFGEVAAAMATLTAAGVDTATSATALRALFVSLIQQADKFRDAGIDILDVVSKKGLQGALQALKEVTDGNIEAMREFVPETRALTAVLSLAGAQSEKFQSNLNEMGNSMGATGDAFKKQSGTAGFAIEKMFASFDKLANLMAEDFLPLFKQLVAMLTDITNLLQPLIQLNNQLQELFSGLIFITKLPFEALAFLLNKIAGTKVEPEVNADTDKATESIDKLDQKLDALDGRTVEINIVEKTTQQSRFGGLVHSLARGGRLGGYGGGDRIRALLEAGEYVIRKEAVRKYGAHLFHMLNNLKMPSLSAPKMKVPSVPAFSFGQGGPVTGGGQDFGTLRLQVGDIEAPVQTTRSVIDLINKEIKRKKMVGING